ncbi:MAG: TonB-dependent receptor, partial [Bacteroidota bacterium]
EGFYKDYFQYPVDLVSGSSLANQGATYSSVYGASEVAFNGKGKASGFEILNRWNYKTFSILASYTYVRSLFTDIQNNYIPSSWDSKHLLTITTSKDLKRNWQLGFKWRYVGGLPYTPYDLETSSNIQAWDAIGQPYLDYSQLNSKRFSAFHQLDLRIDKNYFFNKWTLMLYFDIQNAYNFKNKGQDFIIREKDMDGNYLTMNDGKQYILQSVENLSGTVLPSIGIMLKF